MPLLHSEPEYGLLPEANSGVKLTVPLRSAIEAMPIPACVLDLVGNLAYLNRALRDLLSLESANSVGQHWTVLAQQADRVRLNAEWDEKAHSGPDQRYLFRYSVEDGVQWLETRISPMQVQGRLAGFVCLIEETANRPLIVADPVPSNTAVVADPIDELQSLRAKLNSALRALDIAQQHASIGSWECDPVRNVQVWSANMFRLFGLEPRCTPPSKDWVLERVHPEDRADLASQMERSCGGRGSTSTRFRLCLPDQPVRHFVLESAHDSTSQRTHGIITDVTEQVEYEIQIQSELIKTSDEAIALEMYAYELQEACHRLDEAAMTDSLTGLSNRRSFQSFVERMLQESSDGVSLILLDIDYFKQVNDTHGHLVGDQVLVGVANLLQRLSPRSDIACRFGGEEFAVVLPAVGLQVAARVAERLRRQVEEMDSPIAVTASFGVAWMPPQTEIQSLIAAADRALYSAKRGGRNRVILDSPRP